MLVVPTLATAQDHRAPAPFRDTGMKGNIDWAVSYAPGQVTLAGWVFNCTLQGQQPFDIKALSVTEPGGPVNGFATLIQRASGLYRPDVAKAFTSCGGPLNPYTGYQITIEGVPPGRMLINLEWADSHLSGYNTIIVEVQ